MLAVFKSRYVKNLGDLEQEILKFSSDSDLWRTAGSITNTSGNLSLHLLGNLNHFIGAQLGKTGYVREREKEFADKNISKTTILENLRLTRQMIEKTFDGLRDEDLNGVFPLNTFGENKTVFEVLLFLQGHFSYHLGQINYLRRALESASAQA